MYKFYKPESGIYKASLSNNVIFPLSDKITGLFNVGYDRLMGDAGNSQLVKRQGSKNQFSVMFNAMYEFYSF
jgi:outer membrane scaffolding protein for murein synthesis (MipA/OmpV family)